MKDQQPLYAQYKDIRCIKKAGLNETGFLLNH